ncbi:hypothetical protein N9V13_01310 [Betaproteobacteria bacterium]|nr:hypothetical protein [Betaproteobacteria bacterium]
MNEVNFEKCFDNSYSYFREIQILTYLNQRNAPVPVLLKGSAKEKLITMEFVGENLYDQRNVLSFQNKLVISLDLIQAVYFIYELGILHYDIALRNLTSKDNELGKGSRVYVIDFTVSTSSNFKLQKPLWILPRFDKQHKVFADAISADWNKFFKFFNKNFPENFNEIIEVSRQNYENYWAENLNVERIQSPLSVIFHNVSFALEELFASNATEIKKYNLDKSIYGMRNIYDDTITKKKIEKIKDHIREISENSGGSVPTPVPLISSDTVSVKRLINVNNFIPLEKYERYIHMALLAILFYVADRGYFHNQISINDLDYYTGLFAGLTWITYLILLVTRSGFGLKAFNVILCLQLGYFFFRIFLETGKFALPMISSIITLVIMIRIVFLKS